MGRSLAAQRRRPRLCERRDQERGAFYFTDENLPSGGFTSQLFQLASAVVAASLLLSRFSADGIVTAAAVLSRCGVLRCETLG